MTGVEMTGVERSAGAEVGTETMRKGSLGPPTFLMRNQLLPQKSLTQQPTLLNRRLGTPSPVGKPQAMSTRGLQPLPLPCLLPSNTRGPPHKLLFPKPSSTRGLQLPLPLLAPRGLLFPKPSNTRGLPLLLPLHHWKHHHGMSTQWRWQRRRQSRP